VTAELRLQIHEWRHHLPPSLQFALDEKPLFDPRKSYLRVQYIGLFVIMGWPLILQVLELRDNRHADVELSVKEQAQEGLRSCILMIEAAEEALSRRNLGSQLTLWA
jgi:hypothetical protein